MKRNLDAKVFRQLLLRKLFCCWISSTEKKKEEGSVAVVGYDNIDNIEEIYIEAVKNNATKMMSIGADPWDGNFPYVATLLKQ